MSSSTVAYDHHRAAMRDFRPFVERLVEDGGAHRVCDVGGGCDPVLSLDFVRQNDLFYAILDISPTELDKAPDGYVKVCGDVTGRLDPELVGTFDVVVSLMLAEHIRDPRAFHERVREMLRPGGLALHLFPTLYEPAFAVNRVLPESVSRRLVSKVQPRRDMHGGQGKFPAYYRWCRGPTDKQIARLRSIGYDVLEYRGYFGTGYVNKIPVLRSTYPATTTLLLKHPVPALTSFARVLLRRRD